VQLAQQLGMLLSTLMLPLILVAALRYLVVVTLVKLLLFLRQLRRVELLQTLAL